MPSTTRDQPRDFRPEIDPAEEPDLAVHDGSETESEPPPPLLASSGDGESETDTPIMSQPYRRRRLPMIACPNTMETKSRLKSMTATRIRLKLCQCPSSCCQRRYKAPNTFKIALRCPNPWRWFWCLIRRYLGLSVFFYIACTIPRNVGGQRRSCPVMERVP